MININTYSTDEIIDIVVPKVLEVYNKGLTYTNKIRYYDIKKVLFSEFENIDEYEQDLLKLFTDIMDSLHADVIDSNQNKSKLIKLVELDRDSGADILDDIIEMNLVNKPGQYFMPNNKMTNELSKDSMIYGEQFDLIVSNRREVTNRVMITIDDNVTLNDRNKNFTPYDRTVLDAICSVYEANKNMGDYVSFTIDQVYRCMNGMTGNEKVRDTAREAITESIEKMRSIKADIDITNELKAHGNKVHRSYKLNDYLLSLRGVTIRTGGHEVSGYILNTIPILYDYSKRFRQVVSVPINLLNTSDKLRSTPEVVVTRNHLIRRIEVMKRNTTTGRKITFQNIYDELRLDDVTKEKAKKIRDNVIEILKKYKDDKYIKDFKLYKKAHSFQGVEIVV